MALVQIGFQGQLGPIFTYDDGTLPGNKLVLVRLSRDQFFNKKLVVLDPSYATILMQTSAGDFTATPDNFTLGSYVSGQVLDIPLAQYKYPVVLNTSWTGYKALQNSWATNNAPFANDSNQTAYGVEQKPASTPTNKAPSPQSISPFVIGVGALIILLIINTQSD